MNKIKKALAAAFAFITVLTFTSCGAQKLLSPKPPDLNKLFTFSANVSCGASSFSALFSRAAIGCWEVTVTEPYELQGITFTYTKGKAGASLDGLAAETLTSDFSSSPVACIAEALENAVQDGLASVVYEDGSYSVHSGGTVMTFPQGSSSPNGFELTEKRIKGEITEFNVVEEIFKDGADVVLVM
ncbi:MAG: hypothetical protein NC394_03815 [Bacteroides sp.]|nr:hypothetical protein [Bacteroides sp.]